MRIKKEHLKAGCFRGCYSGRSLHALVLLAFMVLPTTGCVPWASSYYAAHGPGRVFSPGGACSTRYFQDLEVKLEGGAVFIISDGVPSKDSSTVRLSVEIKMPSFQQARLERSTILVQEQSETEERAIPLVWLTVWSRTAPFRYDTILSADTLLDGGAPQGNYLFGDFTAQIDLPYKNPAGFTVAFPALVFPDHVVHIPVITFTYGAYGTRGRGDVRLALKGSSSRSDAVNASGVTL